jgi:DNA gyrase subunit A
MPKTLRLPKKVFLQNHGHRLTLRLLIALIDDPEYFVDDAGNYQMSEMQAKAILELRLHRLTGLERDKIGMS